MIVCVCVCVCVCVIVCIRQTSGVGGTSDESVDCCCEFESVRREKQIGRKKKEENTEIKVKPNNNTHRCKHVVRALGPVRADTIDAEVELFDVAAGGKGCDLYSTNIEY